MGYGGKIDVDILQVVLKEINFVGNICGTYNELVELMSLAASGRVKLTTTTFPLEGVNDALNALNEGRLIGRGVLVPATN